MPRKTPVTSPAEPFTVKFDNAEWRSDPATMRDNVSQDNIDLYKKLCDMGGARNIKSPQSSPWSSHLFIWSALVLSESAGMPKDVQLKLLTGLIPKTCSFYLAHLHREYLAPVQYTYGNEFGSVAQWLFTVYNSCEGVKPGVLDDEGYPIPVNNNSFAYYIVAGTKLLLRLLAEGAIDERVFIKFAIKTSKLNTYSLYLTQTETTRTQAEKIRADRRAVSHVLRIKVGDPRFSWLYRGNTGKDYYALPDVEVKGIRKLKVGDRVIVDLERAKARMLATTGGIDPSDPTTPENLGFIGGSPAKAINAAYDDDCLLLTHTDNDVYCKTAEGVPKSNAHVATCIASMHRLAEMVIARANGHAVVATIDRRSVTTIFPPNDTHPWQLITTSNVTGSEISGEFDWPPCMVEWVGGTDFYMTAEAYWSFVTGQARIRTGAGYNPARVVKIALSGTKIIKDEKLDGSICNEVLSNPARFKELADEILYGRHYFETAGPVPTEIEYKRFMAQLRSNPHRKYVFIGSAIDSGADCGLNAAIEQTEVQPGSFRKSYNNATAIAVQSVAPEKLAPIPAGNHDNYIKKIVGGLLKVRFSNASLMSMEKNENGDIVVKIIADVIESALKTVEKHIGDPITKRSVDGDGMATLIITKKWIDQLAAGTKTTAAASPLSDQHLRPLDPEDYCNARVAGKLCSGEFTIKFVCNGEQNKRYIELQLSNLRIVCKYVRSDIATCAADRAKQDAAAIAPAADAAPAPADYADD